MLEPTTEMFEPTTQEVNSWKGDGWGGGGGGVSAE